MTYLKLYRVRKTTEILLEEDQKHYCYHYLEDGKVREIWRRLDDGLTLMDYIANKERMV